MAEIMVPTRTDLPDALENPSGNLLRPAQMVEQAHEIKVAKAQLANPNIQDKGAVRSRIRTLEQQYEQQAPRPVSDGRVKDAMAKEAQSLLEQITPGMLSQEEMRKNPPGSVDKHLRWERANKSKIVRWKKLQCMLNADQSDAGSWDRDAANLERYRPQGAQDRFRADAQISGKMTYGGVPEEKWEGVFGSVNPPTSALAQAKRVAEETTPEVIPSDAVVTQSGSKKR